MEKLRQWNAAWQWLNPTQPGSQCACWPWWVVRWTVLMTHRIWCDPWLGVKETSQSDHSQTDNHTPSTRTSTKCIPQHLVQADSWPSNTQVFLLHQMLWPVTRKLRQNESIFPVQTALGGGSWQHYPPATASVYSLLRSYLTVFGPQYLLFILRAGLKKFHLSCESMKYLNCRHYFPVNL